MIKFCRTSASARRFCGLQAGPELAVLLGLPEQVRQEFEIRWFRVESRALNFQSNHCRDL